VSAPRVTVTEVRRYEWPFTLRQPFRFGVITVTKGRQAVVHLRIRLEDGCEAWGVAAETLAAKWFDKDPALSDAQNEDQLRRSLEIAAEIYRSASARTAFGHFAESYAAQQEACAAEKLNPLVGGYGLALLDRAVLDALCRSRGVSFYEAMRLNLPGVAPHAIVPDLSELDIGALLAGLMPRDTLSARHTIGLVDPITAADQDSRVEDGLPETLEEVVERYRCRHYKLKVGGDLAADVARLEAIASVLDHLPDYVVSLDGNEQYADAAGVLALWEAIERAPRLERLRRAVRFIEQPVKRAVALDEDMRALAAKRPVIIDESDGTIDAFLRARERGYDGISSKSCKGLYKSILNLARCRTWNAAEGRERFFLSGEDLTTLAGVSVQQDLALVNLLGIAHVERNGHHFIDGFAGRPGSEAHAFLAAHPDLYRDDRGRVRLRIEDGLLSIGSLACPGFGIGAMPDFAAMEKMPSARWPA
jgi:L-alanine-DL-glutamate epimerase-like enolase superfamily enzyme